jgi:flagellar M-ring protein FliF
VNPQDLLTRFKASAAGLSTRQIAVLAAAFLTVVGIVIASAYWLNAPTYDALFSDLDGEAANTVVQRLKTAKVPYRLEDGGRTVKVPSGKVDELRLDVASQGMPASGVGFEIFDKTSFGVTDFMEHVNYRRALEGELARTIGSISEVAGARVHIAIPQPSLFVGQERPTTASVVLKLRQNRQLAPSTIHAITSLVAGSVESLRPEAVVVIDNFGRPLAATSRDEDGSSTGQMERQQRIEQELTTRVVSLLEPIVGEGRVRVNVSAKIATDTQEETEERWDPMPVLRSRQTTSQQTGASPTSPTAAAGARSNLPTGAGAASVIAPALPGAPGNSSVSETANYEVGRFTRHRVQPQGQIARLSVAIVLDDARPPARPTAPAQGGQPAAPPAPPKSNPRTPAEIQKIHDLAAAAVGFDPMRGDQLTVENIAFEETPVEDIPTPPVWVRYQPQAFEVGRILMVLVIALVALLVVVRPMVRGVAGVPVTGDGVIVNGIMQPRTVQDLEHEIDAQLEAEANSVQPRKLPALTRRAASLAEKEPHNAARLLRAWLTEEQR